MLEGSPQEYHHQENVESRQVAVGKALMTANTEDYFKRHFA
ncbi:hypothetical protein DsansV1_C15g0133351 [Dioscorea sansibarensis]